MFPVFETLKVYQGKIYNLDLHFIRMQATAKSLWDSTLLLDHIEEEILIKHHGELQKCKLTYNSFATEFSLVDYQPKQINTLFLCKNDLIKYRFKFTDRHELLGPLKDRKPDMEVLFVKDGLLTDTSFSNIALWNGSEWHTPKYPLLYGTKRQFYLSQHKMKEQDIRIKDLHQYQRVSLINAMLDLNELIVPITNLELNVELS